MNEKQRDCLSKDQTITLKGMAISLVLVDHFFENLFSFPQPPLGAIGVYIFLVLSAYGLVKSAEINGVTHYWSKRLKKVYIPYLLILALCLVLSLAINHSISRNFVYYLFLGKIPVGEYWYLRIQIEWYVAFFIIWAVKRKLELGIRQTAFLIAICDLLIIYANIADRKYAWTLGSFLIGGGMALCGTQWLRHLRKISVAIVLVLISGGALVLKQLPYVSLHELGVIDTILQIVSVFTAAMFVMIFAEPCLGKMGAVNAIIVKLGAFSYELYLVHSIFLDLLRNANSAKEKLAAAILFIALTIILSMFLKRIVALVLKLPLLKINK